MRLVCTSCDEGFIASVLWPPIFPFENVGNTPLPADPILNLKLGIAIFRGVISGLIEGTLELNNIILDPSLTEISEKSTSH